jgi:V-type H+-transporting ATPase subunit E
LWKLQEPEVILVCRKQDLALVKEVVDAAAQEYSRNSEKKCEVKIDQTTFLPPGPEHATSEGEIWYVLYVVA